MADSLEVRLQITNTVKFATGRTDKPAVQRTNPTIVAIYQNGSGIDVIFDPKISLKNSLVQIGPKMDQWTGQQMTDDAITYAASQVKLLIKGAPVNVISEQYRATFEAAYARS